MLNIMLFCSFVLSGRRLYLLANSRKYIVGRVAQCDFRLADDTSVSREHAVIHRSSSGVRIEDTGSKYGVFINDGINTNKEIAKKTAIDLQIGNIVRFGRLENIFRLENFEIKVCTSSMNSDEIDKLNKHLKIMDGKLLSVWSTDCTHLVMTNVTVTVKVLQSLAHGIPIVSPEYFEAYVKCATAQESTLPNVNEFVPPIVEPFIIKEPKMMEVHLERQRLFQNKTFVFMVKRHMEKFAPIILLAAGKCINMEEDKVRRSSLLKSEYIPVQYTPSAHSQCLSDIETIVQYIESHGRRLISEAEIGLAIIHRATDRFCNPDRKLTSTFEPASINTNEIVKHVFTNAETPHTTKSESLNLVVPESADLSGTEPNNNLRNAEAADLDKPSTSTTRRSTRSSTKSEDALNVSTKMPTPKKNPKRKHTDQDDEPQNVAQSSIDGGEHSVPEKKQKTQNAAESQGENSSALFAAPLPPEPSSDHNFSGFISTQSRKRKATQNKPQQQQQEAVAPPCTPESSTASRKRAVRMLVDDSDEEKDDSGDGNLFKFSRKSKRSKITTKQTQQNAPQRNTLADSDDDDEGGFNFTQKKTRPNQVKRKRTQVDSNTNENDVVDAASAAVAEDSYKKPFQQTGNRTFNRTIAPVEITSVPTCNVEWISFKLKKELQLEQPEEKPSQPSQPSSSIRIKEEKLEEWELTNEEKKRQWIKSMANVFKVRKVELNSTRRSVQADETDSLFSDSAASASTSHNKSKNFKKFVKVKFIWKMEEVTIHRNYSNIHYFILSINRKTTTFHAQKSSKLIRCQSSFLPMPECN